MIIPAGFGQITWLYEVSGLPNGAAHTIGFSRDLSVPIADVAAGAFDAWADNLMSLIHNEVTLVGTYVKFGPNDVGANYLHSDTHQGTDGANGSPANCAILVRKTTALGGRQNRGRMYIPPTADVNVTSNGFLAAGVAAAIDAKLALFLSDMEDFWAEPVILHNSSSDPTTVTGLATAAQYATQRRRLRR